MKYIIYGDVKVPAPAHVDSVEAAKGAAGFMIPGLSEAQGRVDADGNYVFEKKAGDKGL